MVYQQWRHQPSSRLRGDERWWGTGDSRTVYLWDTMEDQDRQDSLEVLRDKENWVIWKTKDDKWTHELRQEGFHQLLVLDKNTRAGSWGNKIKGWWCRGDIKATKCKKTRECWVKSPANVPREVPKPSKTHCWHLNRAMTRITTPSI